MVKFNGIKLGKFTSTGKWLKSFQQKSGQAHLNRKAAKSTPTGKWLNSL